MHRFSVLILLIVLALGTPVLMDQAGAGAQEATDEITYEPVTVVGGLDLPRLGNLAMVRIRLTPGAAFFVDPSNSTGGILLAEAGTITAQANSALSVSRAAGVNSAFATTEVAALGAGAPVREEIASGEAVFLQAGDAVHIPGGVSGEIRNDGQQPASGLFVLITPMTIDTPTVEPSPTPIYIESTTP